MGKIRKGQCSVPADTGQAAEIPARAPSDGGHSTGGAVGPGITAPAAAPRAPDHDSVSAPARRAEAEVTDEDAGLTPLAVQTACSADRNRRSPPKITSTIIGEGRYEAEGRTVSHVNQPWTPPARHGHRMMRANPAEFQAPQLLTP